MPFVVVRLVWRYLSAPPRALRRRPTGPLITLPERRFMDPSITFRSRFWPNPSRSAHSNAPSTLGILGYGRDRGLRGRCGRSRCWRSSRRTENHTQRGANRHLSLRATLTDKKPTPMASTSRRGRSFPPSALRHRCTECPLGASNGREARNDGAFEFDYRLGCRSRSHCSVVHPMHPHRPGSGHPDGITNTRWR